MCQNMGFYIAGYMNISLTGIRASGPRIFMFYHEILFLKRWENSRSSVAVIGPRFVADAEREAIAKNWQIGIQTMIAHGWLSEDSPYVVELQQFLNDPSLADVGASISSKPRSGMEIRLDKIVRMAF